MYEVDKASELICTLLICRVRGDVRRKLGDLQGALSDLNSADAIEPNNSFTLRYLLLLAFVDICRYSRFGLWPFYILLKL